MATLATIRTDARSKSDTVDSGRPSDAQFLVWINDGIATLHDILIKQNPDRYTTSTTINSTSGTLEYSLPADFYKLRGVERQISTTNYERVRRFNWTERNDGGIRYRQRGTSLRFTDIDGSTYRIWYIPTATVLEVDGDEYNEPNRYEEYVSTYAARMALIQEESDTSDITTELARLERRILEAAADEDVEEPDSISDIYSYNPRSPELWWDE